MSVDESERACSGSSSGPPPADPPVGLPPTEALGLEPEWAECVALVDREMAADEGDGDHEPEGPWDQPVGSQESWDSWRPRFGQGDEADALPPGQLLVGLTETATRNLGRLSDDELVGRTHHRAKQAPDWTAEQLASGVTRWTLPSGRTHTTTPTRYDT